MENDIVFSLYQKSQTVFSIKELALLFPSISYNNLKRRLSYYVSSGKLKKPRKSIYAKDNYDPFELATKLYSPSYISLETVLAQEGIIFQKYESIFVVSYIKRTIQTSNHTINYKRLKDDILLNNQGIIKKDNYYIATKERAFLDAIFLYKDYHFDNLKPLDWNIVMQLMELYESTSLKKRVKNYHELYQKEYV